jgi:hypothetical protein
VTSCAVKCRGRTAGTQRATRHVASVDEHVIALNGFHPLLVLLMPVVSFMVDSPEPALALRLLQLDTFEEQVQIWSRLDTKSSKLV